MKRLFYFFFALCTGVMASAQSTLVATLTHNGNISSFYGATALSQAHEAAVDGDVINLSSGAFKAVDITKRLTIRGAGMGVNSETNTEPTIIQGPFWINKENLLGMGNTYRYGKIGSASGSVFENLFHNDTIIVLADSLTFNKCRLKSLERYRLPSWRLGDSHTDTWVDDGLNNSHNYFMCNLSFLDCRITGRLWIPENASVSCYNCIVNHPQYDDNAISSGLSSMEFTNCVISRGKWGMQDFHYSYMKNCIYVVEEPYELDNTHTLYNTVCICEQYATGIKEGGKVNRGNILANATNNTNTQVTGLNSVFTTATSYTDFLNDSEDFQLTPEAQTTYLGTDGTQVGIYGGAFPFNTKPTGPQITSCSVANKTSADGKLSVDIVIDNGN